VTQVLDPSTGEVAFETAPTSADDATAAVARAREAQKAWAALGAQGRAALLVDAAARIAADNDLAGLIVTDVGKPIVEAQGEVARSAAILRYIASLATAPTGELYEDATGAQIRVLRVPRGVAVLITPWNFPAAIPVWKLAPALQAGNAVALKPATPGTRVAAAVVEHLHAAGVPEDVIQLIPGGSDTASALLDASPDAVSFTGSTATGEAIAQRMAGRFVPLQLEMGGKNGVYVSASADPAEAAKIALAGAMGYAGQKCTATSLLYVHADAADAVRAELDRQTAALGVGDPREHTVSVGPVIAADHRDWVASQISEAASRGVSVDAGGTALDRPGAFLAPTLLSGGADDDAIHREELFAPVLSVRPVADVDEALDGLESLPYGLVAGIVSPLRAEVEHFARSVEAGLVRINAPTTGLEPHVPFGGVKQSSHGPREQGRAGLEFFSETRTIYG
jgi:acyl-CoA reductase-like NAD-dependent aldehyde dehydrogenase